eukprot:3419037-Amphidinium_carterae.1
MDGIAPLSRSLPVNSDPLQTCLWQSAGIRVGGAAVTSKGDLGAAEAARASKAIMNSLRFPGNLLAS